MTDSRVGVTRALEHDRVSFGEPSMVGSAASRERAGAQSEPRRYWCERLQRDFSLNGVGYQALGLGMNHWVYRRRLGAVRRLLKRNQIDARVRWYLTAGLLWLLPRAGWGLDSSCSLSTRCGAASLERAAQLI